MSNTSKRVWSAASPEPLLRRRAIRLFVASTFAAAFAAPGCARDGDADRGAGVPSGPNAAPGGNGGVGAAGGAAGLGGSGAGGAPDCLHCNSVFPWWGSAALCPGMSQHLLDDIIACVCKPDVCGDACAPECGSHSTPASPTCIQCTGGPGAGYAKCFAQVMACQQDTSPPPECTAGAAQCKGDVLQKCNAGAGGGSPGPPGHWVDQTTCPSGLCNAKVGDCSTAECKYSSQCPYSTHLDCKVPTCEAGVCGLAEGCVGGTCAPNGKCEMPCPCPDGSTGFLDFGPCVCNYVACKADKDCPDAACGGQVCGAFHNHGGLVCMTTTAPAEGGKHSSCVTDADCKCKAQGAVCSAGQCSVIAP
jgi:hypothetical protein